MPAQNKLDMLEKISASLENSKGVFVIDYRGLSVSGKEGRIKLAQKVIEENLSVRQTENLAPLFSVWRTDKFSSITV